MVVPGVTVAIVRGVRGSAWYAVAAIVRGVRSSAWHVIAAVVRGVRGSAWCDAMVTRTESMVAVSQS